MADEKQGEEITEQDLRGLEAAVKVARALGQLEPLLRKAITANDRLRYLAAEVRELTVKRDELAGNLQREREAVIARAEAEAQTLVTQGRQEAEKLLRDAATHKASVMRTVEAERSAAMAIVDRLKQEQIQAEQTIKDLGRLRVERSESMSAEIGALKAKREAAVAEVAATTRDAEAEKSRLQDEIAGLKKERERIREELKSILK